MNRHSLVIIVIGVTCGLAATAQTRVAERQGNLVLLVPGQPERVLTRSGRDFDPVLSPSGDIVAFCRKGESGESRSSQLWEVSIGESAKEKMLNGKPLSFEKWHVSGCEKPDFSPDDKLVYCMLEFSDTSGVIGRANLSTGDVVAITTGLDVHVVKQGRYAG